MNNGTVHSATIHGIATIRFSHPQSNSLPGELLRELAQAIREAGENPDARVIVIRSDGEKAFCAGASFDELISIHDVESGSWFFNGFAAVINAIREVPKFVIARVQGKAVGGGVGLAAAADYTLAHQSASVKLSELAVGIGPFVVGPAVERKMGTSGFTQLAIDAASWKDAAWAREKGLFADVFATHSELDLAVEHLAATLAASSPDAMAMLKKVFWKGTENWDQLLPERASMSGQLVLSEFTRNAISKFKAGAR